MTGDATQPLKPIAPVSMSQPLAPPAPTAAAAPTPGGPPAPTDLAAPTGPGNAADRVQQQQQQVGAQQAQEAQMAAQEAQQQAEAQKTQQQAEAQKAQMQQQLDQAKWELKLKDQQLKQEAQLAKTQAQAASSTNAPPAISPSLASRIKKLKLPDAMQPDAFFKMKVAFAKAGESTSALLAGAKALHKVPERPIATAEQMKPFNQHGGYDWSGYNGGGDNSQPKDLTGNNALKSLAGGWQPDGYMQEINGARDRLAASGQDLSAMGVRPLTAPTPAGPSPGDQMRARQQAGEQGLYLGYDPTTKQMAVRSRQQPAAAPQQQPMGVPQQQTPQPPQQQAPQPAPAPQIPPIAPPITQAQPAAIPGIPSPPPYAAPAQAPAQTNVATDPTLGPQGYQPESGGIPGTASNGLLQQPSEAELMGWQPPGPPAVDTGITMSPTADMARSQGPVSPPSPFAGMAPASTPPTADPTIAPEHRNIADAYGNAVQTNQSATPSWQPPGPDTQPAPLLAQTGGWPEEAPPGPNPSPEPGAADPYASHMQLAMGQDTQPAERNWATTQAANQWLAQRGAGSHDEAADYFSKTYGPEAGQMMGRRVFDLGNERLGNEARGYQVDPQTGAANTASKSRGSFWNPLNLLPLGTQDSVDDLNNTSDMMGQMGKMPEKHFFGSIDSSTPEGRDKRLANLHTQVDRLGRDTEYLDNWMAERGMDGDAGNLYRNQLGAFFEQNPTLNFPLMSKLAPFSGVGNLERMGNWMRSGVQGLAGALGDGQDAISKFQQGDHKGGWSEAANAAGGAAINGSGMASPFWAGLDMATGAKPTASVATQMADGSYKAPGSGPIAELGGQAKELYTAVKDLFSSSPETAQALTQAAPPTPEEAQALQQGQMPEAWLGRAIQAMPMLAALFSGGGGGGGGGQPQSYHSTGAPSTMNDYYNRGFYQ